jgi:hypothetical protein
MPRLLYQPCRPVLIQYGKLQSRYLFGMRGRNGFRCISPFAPPDWGTVIGSDGALPAGKTRTWG